jgi:hypothetical protein
MQGLPGTARGIWHLLQRMTPNPVRKIMRKYKFRAFFARQRQSGAGGRRNIAPAARLGSSEVYFFSFSLAAGTGAAFSAGAGAGFLASFFGFLASLLLFI